MGIKRFWDLEHDVDGEYEHGQSYSTLQGKSFTMKAEMKDADQVEVS